MLGNLSCTRKSQKTVQCTCFIHAFRKLTQHIGSNKPVLASVSFQFGYHFNTQGDDCCIVYSPLKSTILGNDAPKAETNYRFDCSPHWAELNSFYPPTQHPYLPWTLWTTSLQRNSLTLWLLWLFMPSLPRSPSPLSVQSTTCCKSLRTDNICRITSYFAFSSSCCKPTGAPLISKWLDWLAECKQHPPPWLST